MEFVRKREEKIGRLVVWIVDVKKDFNVVE